MPESETERVRGLKHVSAGRPEDKRLDVSGGDREGQDRKRQTRQTQDTTQADPLPFSFARRRRDQCGTTAGPDCLQASNMPPVSLSVSRWDSGGTDVMGTERTGEDGADGRDEEGGK